MSEAPIATVLVVDDDPDARRSLASLLQAGGYRAIAFASGEEFLASPEAAEPGCVVLDMNMPGLNGTAVQDEIVRRGVPMSVVFLTAFGEIPLSVSAIKKGAIDFLEKPAHPAALLEAVRSGLEAVRHAASGVAERADWERRVSHLTERERQVLHEVMQGRLNKQVASRLGLAMRTVKHHRSKGLAKLGVGSIAELARRAERFGPLVR